MRKIFLVYLFICIVAIGCKRENNSPVSFAIEEEVARGEGTIINVAKLTTFDWDRLYVFGSYTSIDHIHNGVGIQFLKAENFPKYLFEGSSIASIQEELTLFVFVKKSKVVHYFFHARGRGDFAGHKRAYGTADKGDFQDKNLVAKLLKARVINNASSNSNRVWFGIYFLNEASVIERLEELSIKASGNEAKQIWTVFQPTRNWHYTPDNAKFKVLHGRKVRFIGTD